MRVHAPVYPVAGHGKYASGQRVAWIRAAPAFSAYRQIRFGAVAEHHRGVAALQGPLGDQRLAAPLPARRGISYLLRYIGAFREY